MLIDLIEVIYEAVINPTLWPDVLDQINRHFGGAHTAIVPFRNPSAVLISNGSQEVLDAYSAYWWKYDVGLQEASRRNLKGFVSDWQMISSDVMNRNTYYQEFRRPLDMKLVMGFISGTETDQPFSLSINLPFARNEAPGAAIVSDVTTLGKHFERAFDFQRLTSAARAADHIVADLIDGLSCGVALVDTAGEVVLANAAMEALATSGLRIANHRFLASNHAEQRVLDALIRSVVAPAAVWGNPRAIALGSDKDLRRRPLLIDAMPLPRRDREPVFATGLARARALISAVDSGARVTDRSREALRALGLSSSEARIASLVGAGRSPREAATALGITENTARTQLKHVFDKLAMSRQSELSHLVGRLDAIVRSRRG